MWQRIRKWSKLAEETVVRYDVVQVGYGPVGQTSGALLGRLGYRVAIFERHANLYPLPRAGHVDHEIMRVFQSIGAAGAVMEDAYRCSNYQWRNQHGEKLLSIDWAANGVSGWASDYLVYQPYVEQALHAAVQRQASVEVNHGWEAVDLHPVPDGTKVTFAQCNLDASGKFVPTGNRRTVHAKYVIGVDGANSFVRKAQGFEYVDLGFNERWLVCDFSLNELVSFEIDNAQICDPAGPMCLFQLGKTHRRFEFMVMPNDDADALANPDLIWTRVSQWLSPAQAKLIRAAVYTFRSANVPMWRWGRTLIAGDAAHLMPPFLGQGMCSGIRDATNLAWKLDLVLRGLAPDTLLDTYTVEPKPHVEAIIEQSVALGRIACTTDSKEAEQRDAMFISGQAPPPPPFPRLIQGIFQTNPSPQASAVVGELGPQGEIVMEGKKQRADDLLGVGWQWIHGEDNLPPFGPLAQRVIECLGVRIVRVSQTGDCVDLDGTYSSYFRERGICSVLVRPDFYVFGALSAGEGADALFEDLAALLELRLDTRASMPETYTLDGREGRLSLTNQIPNA